VTVKELIQQLQAEVERDPRVADAEATIYETNENDDYRPHGIYDAASIDSVMMVCGTGHCCAILCRL